MNSMNDKISSSIERAKGFSQIVENAISAVLKKVEVFSNGLGDLGAGKDSAFIDLHNLKK